MIKVGDVRRCKLYNVPEKKHYGEIWQAEILAISSDNLGDFWGLGESWRPFLVKRPSGVKIWLTCREVSMSKNGTKRLHERLKYSCIK